MVHHYKILFDSELVLTRVWLSSVSTSVSCYTVPKTLCDCLEKSCENKTFINVNIMHLQEGLADKNAPGRRAHEKHTHALTGLYQRDECSSRPAGFRLAWNPSSGPNVLPSRLQSETSRVSSFPLTSKTRVYCPALRTEPPSPSPRPLTPITEFNVILLPVALAADVLLR